MEIGRWHNLSHTGMAIAWDGRSAFFRRRRKGARRDPHTIACKTGERAVCTNMRLPGTG